MAKDLPTQPILITGGRGALASVVARHFVSCGVPVTTYSRNSNSGHRALSELFSSNQLELGGTLLHLAWSTVPFTAEEQLGDTGDDLQLLAIILQRLAGMPDRERPHFVFFSSGGTVYGNALNGRPHSETDFCAPVGRHGQAKLAAEQLIEKEGRRHGLTWTILRISNPYGFRLPTARPQGIIPVALRSAREGTPLTIWGDGTARKDYLYYSDFIRALEKIILLRPIGIYNVSCGQSHSIRELLAIVEQVTSGRIAVQHVPAHSWDVHDSLLDNTKLCTAIDWRPRISLRDGIERTAKDFIS